MPSTNDASALRAAAEAQLDRLQGPLWASEGEDDGWTPPATAATAATATRRGARPKTTTTAARKRSPGRPAMETPRLPRREVRIPVVVDERAREVAAWGGLEPTDALWLLASLGWEAWRAGRVVGTAP
jgi:hypothetical protein